MINDKPSKVKNYFLYVRIQEMYKTTFYGNIIVQTELSFLKDWVALNKIVHDKSIDLVKELNLWNKDGVYHIAIDNCVFKD